MSDQNRLPQAKILDLISKFLFKTRAKKRNCMMCGTEFTGLRNVCDKEWCQIQWTIWCQEHLKQYSVQTPSGQVMFLDYTFESRLCPCCGGRHQMGQ